MHSAYFTSGPRTRALNTTLLAFVFSISEGSDKPICHNSNLLRKSWAALLSALAWNKLHLRFAACDPLIS